MFLWRHFIPKQRLNEAMYLHSVLLGIYPS